LGVASIHPSYLEKALNCGESRRFVEQRIRTTAGQSGVSGSDVKAIPVPICSLDEQHQIVKFLAAELSRSDKMMEEIEFSLMKSEALRQSVLKKAFSGRLVSQDPNDEPAAVLLGRLRAEKARQQKPGKASRRVRRV
jgi:type I restriction enzyme S subunit